MLLGATESLVLLPDEAWAHRICSERRSQGWWGTYPFDPQRVWPHTMWVGPWRYWNPDEMHCGIEIPLFFLLQEEARAFTVRVFRTGEMECSSIFGESVVINGRKILNHLGVAQPRLTVKAVIDLAQNRDMTARGKLTFHVDSLPTTCQYLRIDVQSVYLVGTAEDPEPAPFAEQFGFEYTHRASFSPPSMSTLQRGVYKVSLLLIAPSSATNTILSSSHVIIGNTQLIPDEVLDAIQNVPSLIELAMRKLLESNVEFSAAGDHSAELLNPTWARCAEKLNPQICLNGFRNANLTRVNLHTFSFPNTSLEFCTTLAHLEDLRLEGPDPQALGDLSFISKLTRLRRLTVAEACVSFLGVLEAAQSLQNLRVLNLEAMISDVVDVRLKGKAILQKMLGQLDTLSLVSVLNVQNALEGASSTSLRSLNISHNHRGIHRRNVRTFLKHLSVAFPNLERLNYRNCTLHPSELNELANFHNLRYANVSSCHEDRMDVDYVALLQPLIKLPRLSKFVYYNRNHSPVDVQAIESTLVDAGKIGKASRVSWGFDPALSEVCIRPKKNKFQRMDCIREFDSAERVDWSSLMHWTVNLVDVNGNFWMRPTNPDLKTTELRFFRMCSFASEELCQINLIRQNPRFFVTKAAIPVAATPVVSSE